MVPLSFNPYGYNGHYRLRIVKHINTLEANWVGRRLRREDSHLLMVKCLIDVFFLSFLLVVLFLLVKNNRKFKRNKSLPHLINLNVEEVLDLGYRRMVVAMLLYILIGFFWLGHAFANMPSQLAHIRSRCCYRQPCKKQIFNGKKKVKYNFLFRKWREQLDCWRRHGRRRSHYRSSTNRKWFSATDACSSQRLSRGFRTVSVFTVKHGTCRRLIARRDW